jgi:hypothetical protein
VRHHLTPSAFNALELGEQRFLLASIQVELEDEQTAIEKLKAGKGGT